MEARVVSSFVAIDMDGEESDMYEGDQLEIHSHDDGGFSFSIIGDDDISSNDIFNYQGSPVERLCDWILEEESLEMPISEEYIKPKINVNYIRLDDEAELMI